MLRMLILVPLLACAKPVDYMLKGGSVVRCSWRSVTECGVELAECTDGEEYFCQQNVRTQKGKIAEVRIEKRDGI